MRKSRRLLALAAAGAVLATSGLFVSWAPGASAVSVNGYVAGRVTAANSGAAIVGACVTARFGTATTQTVSGPDGLYLLPVPYGSFSYDISYDSNCGAGGHWARVHKHVTIDVLAGHPAAVVNQALPIGGRIVGHVTDAQTGSPVNGVRVFVDSASDYFEAYTDAAGHFVVGSLPPDSYAVDYYGPQQYLPGYYETSLPAGPDRPAQVIKGQDFVADQALNRYAVVSGTVTDAATGMPVQSTAITFTDSHGFARGGGSTDATGHYTVYLPPATMTVEFTSPRPYTTQYWDHTTDPASATPLVLDYGQVVTGIDAAMTR
jgi:hypothetical protein